MKKVEREAIAKVVENCREVQCGMRSQKQSAIWRYNTSTKS